MTSKKKSASKTPRSNKAAKAASSVPARTRKSPANAKAATRTHAPTPANKPFPATATVESATGASTTTAGITLARTQANFAALRKMLKIKAGKAAAEHDKPLDEALRKLETGYRLLLGKP